MMSAHQSNTHTHHLYSAVSSKKLTFHWWTLYGNSQTSFCWWACADVIYYHNAIIVDVWYPTNWKTKQNECPSYHCQHICQCHYNCQYLLVYSCSFSKGLWLTAGSDSVRSMLAFSLCFFSQRPLTLNWENQLDCQTTEWSIVFSVFGHPLSTRWLYYGSEEIYFDPKETEGTCLWMESGRWRLKTPLTTENMALSKAAAAGLRFTLHNQHPVWATLEQVEIKWKCSSFWCIAMSPSLAVWGLVSFVLGLLECLCRYSAMPPLFPASTDLALPPPSTNFSFASPKDTGNLLTCSQSWSKIWSFITTFQFSEK